MGIDVTDEGEEAMAVAVEADVEAVEATAGAGILSEDRAEVRASKTRD